MSLNLNCNFYLHIQIVYLLLFLSISSLNAQERIKVSYSEYFNIMIPVKQSGELYINLEENKTVWVEKVSGAIWNYDNSFDTGDIEELNTRDSKPLSSGLRRTIPDDYIITDYNNKEIEIIQDLGTRVFSVPDNFIEKKWELHKESKMVNDIECFKATTTFRGNTWEVWYAPSLPYPYGPWKLNGLPGLILEATSTDGYHTYIAEKIKNNYPKKEPVIPRNKILKEISFKEYLEYNDYLFNYLFLDKDAPEPKDIFATKREKEFEVKANLS